MSQIFMALLTIFLVQTLAQAADKIRITTPGDAAHFTMHLAQKRGFLKEEGFEAELITISGPVANIALSNGDTDYFSGFGSALRSILQGLPLRIVACYRPTPHFMLQSRPEFKSVKDLKGKAIGITAFGSGSRACSMPPWPLSPPIIMAGRWAIPSSYDRKTSLPIPSAA
jgi:ABC-type nitrate/sulfonate/bicarbonate transport system substrate-binding protein